MMRIDTAVILSKKTIKIDDNLKSVFKVQEACIGICDDEYFIPIIGNNIGKKISTDWENKSIGAIVFDFSKILDEGEYDLMEGLNRFSSILTSNIHELNAEKGIRPIKDKTALEETKKLFQNKVKEFDESDMNRESNISKLYQEIKKIIISQDKQIMMILTSLFKNNRVIESKLNEDTKRKLKENILIVGPTGTGKTEILTRISKQYQLPIVIADSTSLSEVGYKGRNVEDLLRDLYIAANKDIEMTQKGILVIDEFDKLAEKNNSEMVSRSGVQRSLLKILDGSKIYFDGMVFDTSKLTIVGLCP